MATLSKIQEVERANLKRLTANILRNENSIDELSKILSSYENINDDDPLPHIKRAMKTYTSDD